MKSLSISTRTYRTHKPFRIARGEKSTAEQVIVEIRDGIHKGRGACVPYGRYGESLAGVMADIERVREQIEHTPDSDIPALRGAAKNAVNCALIDLQARKTCMPVWDRFGCPKPVSKPTAITLSVNTPVQMGDEAASLTDYSLLKVKLAGDALDKDRIACIHARHRTAMLIIDANESLTRPALDALSQSLPWDRVALIEQPLPVGQDEDLRGYQWRQYLCADESFHGAEELPKIAELYGAINIKLDKAGGFSGALLSAQQAQKLDLKIMLGCMLGSSLAMAPAFMLSGFADYLDLDGPLLLKDDDAHGFRYTNGLMHPCPIWGYGDVNHSKVRSS